MLITNMLSRQVVKVSTDTLKSDFIREIRVKDSSLKTQLGGAIPRVHLKIEEGIMAMETGPIAGYQVMDMESSCMMVHIMKWTHLKWH